MSLIPNHQGCEYFSKALCLNESLKVESLPGHRLAVDEASIGALHDLKAQVGPVHADRNRWGGGQVS